MDAGLCCEVGFRLEGDEYKLPENEIVVDIEVRELLPHCTESSTSAPIPSYVSTCYDEFSREFCSYSVADSAPNAVPLVNYEETSLLVGPTNFPDEADSIRPTVDASGDLNLGQRFLQNYHPCYPGWNSTFKHCPPSTRHMLATGPRVISSDSHILFEINPNYAMKQEFEPVFGSMTLYTFMNDCCVRLSESFHFDCTTKHVKIRFKDVYASEDSVTDKGEPMNAFTPTNLSLFTIPEEFKKKDVFIVMQLTKVLTADAEKAAAPYVRSSGYPVLAKHLESCRRLYPFRQPLGLAVLRLFDQKGLSNQKQSQPIKFSFYAMKATLNEHYLGQLIRDIFPVDGPSHARLDTLELSMSIRIFDLGKESQLAETLLTVPGLVDTSTGRMRGRLIPSQFEGREASELKSDEYNLGVLGDYFKQGAIIKEMSETYVQKKIMASMGGGDSACIRHVAILSPAGSKVASDPIRQMKSSIDNTIYVYPLLFEKFNHRNLCIKVQLVEFVSSFTGKLPDPTQPYHVLRNVYSTMQGHAFSSSAFTTVSYHSKLPILSEEIKIRLPDVLTDRHWLIMTVHHVHVKQKTATNKSFLGMVTMTPGELLDTSATILGAGFLPIIADGKALLSDAEYPVHIFDFGESVNHSIAYSHKTDKGKGGKAVSGSQSPSPVGGKNASAQASEILKKSDTSILPVVRIRTRALCSTVSSCRKVQAALSLQPPPLGRLPTSIMPVGEYAEDDSDSLSTTQLLRLSLSQKMSPATLSPGGAKSSEDTSAESRLAMVTGELGGASALEVTRFFLILMRQLTRTLCGGTCVYSRSRANPYAHTSSRCQAFLALLQVLGKVAPESTLFRDKDKDRIGGGAGSEELLLQAYVEFLLDEEVPLDNIALLEGTRIRTDPLRNTLPIAKGGSAESFPHSQASSKRASVTSNSEDPGLMQLKLMFKKDIRLDDNGPQSSQKPPLQPNRNSLKLSQVFEEQECPQSVLSPTFSNSPFSQSPRSSLRLDSSVLDTSISLISVPSAVKDPSSRVSLMGRIDDVALAERLKRTPPESSDNSSRSVDIYDSNGDLVNNDVDETHSSDSEEEDEEDMMKDVSGIFSEDSDVRYLSTVLSRQGSSSGGDGGPTGDSDNFDSEVQRMDLNIETLNEQGLNNDAEANSEGSCDSDGDDIQLLTLESAGHSSSSDPSLIALHHYLIPQLYPEDESEDCLALVNKVWNKGDELNQSASEKIIEKLSGKRLTFTKDGARGSKGGEPEDEMSQMRSPSKEKSTTKRLPATQVFEEIALQLCLQAERAVLEAAVEDAVMFTVLSSLSADNNNANHFSVIEKTLARKNVRWWGHELHTKKRPANPNVPINSLQLPPAMSGAPTGSGYVARNLPFDCEGAWFQQIENGDLKMRAENTTGCRRPHQTDMETPGSRSVCGRDSSDNPQLPIISPEPRYNRISGFASRQQRQSMRMSFGATATMQHLMEGTNGGAANAAGREQWWPWLYEVLTHQWCSLLVAFQVRVSHVKQPQGMKTPVSSPPAFDGLSGGMAGRPSTPRSMTIAPYPLDVHTIQKNSPQHLKDTRTLLADQGSLLFKMILKSLVLRISREGKRPPVILDDQYFFVLESLITAIATEIVTNHPHGAQRYRRLNGALATFLRDLFAVVAPSQVSTLVDVYFTTMHGHHGRSRTVETELRLQFLEELSLFDHALAANFPYTLDSPLSLFSHQISSKLYPITTSSSVGVMPPSVYSPVPQSKAPLLNSPTPGEGYLVGRVGDREQSRVLRAEKEESVVLAYSARGLRGTSLDPTPHWLGHLIIEEMMSAYRSDEKWLKTHAVTVLRDLLVRHSYDIRYQTKEACHRIAILYLPLVAELVIEAIRLSLLHYNNSERKELLAMLMSLLGDLTSRVLRDCIRQLCQPNCISLTNFGTTSSKNSGKDREKESSPLPIMRLLLLLHLSLDTFEYPETVRKDRAETDAENHTGSYKQVACPSINMATTDAPVQEFVSETQSVTSEALKRNSGRLSALQLKPRSSSGEHSVTAGALLDRLESRMQNRKASLAIGGGGWNSQYAENIVTGEDRKWVSHVQSLAVLSSLSGVTGKEGVLTKNLGSTSLTSTLLQSAAKNISRESTAITVQVIRLMLEECPEQILSLSHSLSALAPGSLFGDVFPESQVEPPNASRDFLSFMQMVLSVLLHGISGNQSVDSFCRLFECSCFVIKRFGFRLFQTAAGDSLQDWVRCALTCCASKQKEVSKCACDFISYLLYACFFYTGSLSKVSLVLLTVFDDVGTSILESNRELIRYHSDENALLQPLQANIVRMKEAQLAELKTPNSSKAAYASAVVTLMNNLLLLFRATGYLRRHVTHPVGYDWLGVNMLDGPFDDRSTAYTNYLRNSRKAVTTKNIVQVDLEAVMEVFVEASEIFDPISLPRMRIRWLENLARLHDQKGNKSEGAEIRWRIFKICETCQHSWPSQWVPRQPLDWYRRGCEDVLYTHSKYSGAGNNWQPVTGASSQQEVPVPWLPGFDHSVRAGPTVRSFLTVLSKAITSQPCRAWQSSQQYFQHMETSLSVCAQKFGALNLIHLAERASYRLLDLYRDAGKIEKMASEYRRAASAFREISDLASTQFALGTFYSVLYLGLGVPYHLRGREFIYRNANNLHVSEFQAFVKTHLKALVTSPGSEVVFLSVNRLSPLESFETSKHANVVMTSVRPIFQSTLRAAQIDTTVKGPGPIDATTLTNTFRYSIPYTQDRSKVHARGVDQQWKRTIILSVKESFPGMFSRQPVMSSKCFELSPIEVSLEDIEERVEVMQKELDLDINGVGGAGADTNNLMRLVQGTVMPQVNAGAGEVARVFLSPSWRQPASNTLPTHLSSSPLTSASSSSPRSTSPLSPSLSARNLSTSPSPSSHSLPYSREEPLRDVIPETETEMLEREAKAESRVTTDKRALVALGVRLQLKLKATLIEFLYLSKCLLIKSRRLLVDTTPSTTAQSYSGRDFDLETIYGGAPSSPSIQSQRHNTSGNLLSGTAFGGSNSTASSTSTSASVGGPSERTMGIVIAPPGQKAAPVVVNALLESNTVWQKEMEKGYDSLLEAILPFLGSMATNSRLQRDR